MLHFVPPTKDDANRAGVGNESASSSKNCYYGDLKKKPKTSIVAHHPASCPGAPEFKTDVKPDLSHIQPLCMISSSACKAIIAGEEGRSLSCSARSDSSGGQRSVTWIDEQQDDSSRWSASVTTFNRRNRQMSSSTGDLNARDIFLVKPTRRRSSIDMIDSESIASI